MAAIIVYGPQGTGKSLHAKTIAQHYGKARIVDMGETDFSRIDKRLDDDVLAVTNHYGTAELHALHHGAQIVMIDEAKAAAGIRDQATRAACGCAPYQGCDVCGKYRPRAGSQANG